MRIIYIHQYFATPSMAGGTRSYEFAKKLVLSGHEVTIITALQNSSASTKAVETVEEGIRVHWIPVAYSNKMSYRDRVKSFIKFAWSAYRAAIKIKCDLVFATSTPLTVALPGIYAARRQHVPFVFEVRDLWPEMPIAVKAIKNPIAISLARKLENFSYQNAKHIIALSPGMRDGVIATGCPESKVSIIPNFCNISHFGKKEFGDMPETSLIQFDGKKVVLYAGTIGPLNNLGYLVDIAAESIKIDKNVVYLIVGEGAEKQMIEKKANTLSILNKNFFVFPQATKAQMPRFFQRADLSLSLFANIKEMWANSANKFFDGLASGTPIVINYQGWQAEILKKYDAGIVVPPDDPKASAEMINRLLYNQVKTRAMANNALNLAEREFSNINACKKFEKILIDCLR